MKTTTKYIIVGVLTFILTTLFLLPLNAQINATLGYTSQGFGYGKLQIWRIYIAQHSEKRDYIEYSPPVTTNCTLIGYSHSAGDFSFSAGIGISNTHTPVERKYAWGNKTSHGFVYEIGASRNITKWTAIDFGINSRKLVYFGFTIKFWHPLN